MLDKLFSLYLAPIKAYLLAFVVVVVSGYVIYLNFSILGYERENKRLQEQYIECHQERASLEANIRYKEKAIETLKDYYKSRKPFDDSKNELRRDEILN